MSRQQRVISESCQKREAGKKKPRTMTLRTVSKYLQPRFCVSGSQGSGDRGQLLEGMTRRPITAERTAPNEKNTESSVSKYCFPRGMFSRNNVPSVGMLPLRMHDYGQRTRHPSDSYRTGTYPTALPRKNNVIQRDLTPPAKVLAQIPNKLVKSKVALNAIVLPRRSEPGCLVNCKHIGRTQD